MKIVLHDVYELVDLKGNKKAERNKKTFMRFGV